MRGQYRIVALLSTRPKTLTREYNQKEIPSCLTRERLATMTTPTKQQQGPTSAQHQEFSLERISRLVADLEQELAKAPGDVPRVQDLKEEIQTLKQVLASSDENEVRIDENLHAIRNALQDVTARVEGEVLKDTPYIAEIGRILGLV